MARKQAQQRTPFAEAANISNEDWRLQAATTLAKPAVINGKTFSPDTTVVKAVAIVQYDYKTVLRYGLPSTPALMLDFAHDMYAACPDMLACFDAVDGKGTRPAHDDAALMKLLERRMAVVIFSFTALEAFCNEVIARAYGDGFEYQRVDPSLNLVPQSLAQIERLVPLDEKLGVVLPQIFGVPTPKGKVEWSNYKRLKKIRDRIIHNKQVDRIPSQGKDETLWRFLSDSDFRDFPTHAKGIIDYYWQTVGGDKTARWYEKYPW